VLKGAGALEQGEAPPAATTGFPGIDRPTGGMRPGHLVTLAGTTSVGKSALAVCIARNVAETGKPVLFVSAEMDAGEVAQRFLQVQAEVSGGRIMRGDLEARHWQRLHDAEGEFAKWKVRIFGRSATVGQIAGVARKATLQWRQKLGLLVVDYAQIMQPPKDQGKQNREQQVNSIALGLKWLAGELGCPCLMLAQLNRQSDREGRAPELHDLRESGAIEQHSNTVLLLRRPPDEQLDPTPGSGEHWVWLRVAKCRSGRVTPWPNPKKAADREQQNAVKLRFVPAQTRFVGGKPQPAVTVRA